MTAALNEKRPGARNRAIPSCHAAGSQAISSTHACPKVMSAPFRPPEAAEAELAPQPHGQTGGWGSRENCGHPRFPSERRSGALPCGSKRPIVDPVNQQTGAPRHASACHRSYGPPAEFLPARRMPRLTPAAAPFCVGYLRQYKRINQLAVRRRHPHDPEAPEKNCSERLRRVKGRALPSSCTTRTRPALFRDQAPR